ncbi:Mariner Mos1 transposase, partial [Acromyrmex echinatior]
VVLIHDNARPHVSVKQTPLELEWGVLPFRVFSSIVPSDFHLFWLMQHALEDTCFHNSKDVRTFVENWINSEEESFYRCVGINLLPRLDIFLIF